RRRAGKLKGITPSHPPPWPAPPATAAASRTPGLPAPPAQERNPPAREWRCSTSADTAPPAEVPPQLHSPPPAPTRCAAGGAADPRTASPRSPAETTAETPRPGRTGRSASPVGRYPSQRPERRQR